PAASAGSTSPSSQSWSWSLYCSACCCSGVMPGSSRRLGFARQLDEPLARPVQQRLHRAQGQIEAGRGLLIRLVFHVEENYRLPVTFRELVEQLGHAHGRRVVRGGGGQIGDFRMALVVIQVDRGVRSALAQ